MRFCRTFSQLALARRELREYNAKVTLSLPRKVHQNRGMFRQAQMYRCTRHKVFMVIVRQKFEAGTLEYYRCAVRGCEQVKPSKWAPRLPKNYRRMQGAR